MRTLYKTLLLACYIWVIAPTSYAESGSAMGSIDSLKTAMQGAKDKELVDLYNDISWKYRNIRIDSSLIYGQRAYNLAVKLNYPLGISTSLNFIGIAKRNHSNFLGALENFFEALKHAEQSRNLIQISYSLINIGNIYVFQTNYDGAIQYFEKALINAEKLEDIDLMAYCHVNLGRSYTGLEQYEKAEENLLEAIKLRKEQNNQEGTVITRVDLANLYILSDRLDEAQTILLSNLPEVNALGHKTTLAYSYLNLSKIRLKQNQLNDAERYAKITLQICIDNDIKKVESDVLQLLSSIYEAGSNNKKALLYHQMYVDKKDSIFSEENTRKIESLHASYEAEKKEAETRYLKQQSELNQMVISRQKIIIWLAIISSVLFLAFAIITFKASRDRRKMTLQIEKQKEEAYKHNNSLIDLNHEKNNLIRILSHDLRAPINNIKGLTQIHQSSLIDKMSESDNQMLEHIIGESDRLLEMITKILNVEALEEESKNYISDRINVNYVLQQVLNNYLSAAKSKNIKITSKLGTKPSFIMGDQIHFYQVVENLISNAIKFSERNTEITVEVSIPNENGRVRISFIDQGPGLTDDDKKKIFNKFQTLSAKPTGNEQSTGLGLSIVKQYVEQMEGKISVESEVGKGSNFSIEFFQAKEV
ncbi:ATP-binding protein [Reichenbachiella agarivorans]|uniref:histidine kinase n=1 Tax=Reichenbachiella agarivorans TaxID=2979464 RepID=A0ABY6CLL5_9BACT|nr:ATP-binding protein [Reichenbachiella agarivorans]UXP31415.1 ATP-binding protein [Reichenbachiella agarivorans]